MENEIWLHIPGWVGKGVKAESWEHLQQLLTKDYHIIRIAKTVVKVDNYKLEDE